MARGNHKPQTKAVEAARTVGFEISADRPRIGENPRSELGQGNFTLSKTRLVTGNVVSDYGDEMKLLDGISGGSVDMVNLTSLGKTDGKVIVEKDEMEKPSGRIVRQNGKLEKETTCKQPWVDIIRDNRLPSKEVKMEFCAPMIVDGIPEVELEHADTHEETEFWKNGLILFAAGKELSMNAIKNFIERAWSFVTMPDIFYHEDGYFIAKFHSSDEREAVLMRGPYSIFSAPLILRKWAKGFAIKDEMLRLMPIWVKFPRLPLHLWGAKSLSKIASVVGVPLTMDECTVKKLRISYARVLIEMDVTQERRSTVRIKEPDGSSLVQPIEYEWLPRYCAKCDSFGHDCCAKEVPPGEGKQAEKEIKKIWRPKVSESFEEACERASKASKDLMKAEISESLEEAVKGASKLQGEKASTEQPPMGPKVIAPVQSFVSVTDEPPDHAWPSLATVMKEQHVGNGKVERQKGGRRGRKKS